MPNWNELEQTLTRHLNLDRAPVAITFCDAAPAGVRKFDGSVPSGCTFWKVAATAPAGRGAFYTVAADHQNCPIGAHTHNVPQVDGGRMLNEMLGMMAGLGYVTREEVPQIPRWAADAGRGGLRPARRSPSRARRGHRCVPRVGRDVPGRSRSLRRGGLSDAAAAPPDVHGDSRRRGARGDDVARLHRQSRLHGIPDDRVYMMVRGADLGNVADALDGIMNANAQLTTFHQTRLPTVTSGEAGRA